MDENLSETEKLIIFRSAKVVFIALATYFLLRNFPHSDLPVFQLSLVMGMLSAFRYFQSIVYVFIFYLLVAVSLPPQFFSFIFQLVK
jgi:hypothetical protein